MILVWFDSIACMLLEKKFIKKLINMSFLSLKCFQHSFFSETVSVCNTGRGHNPQTFVPFRYNCLLFRNFRAKGEENILWGMNRVMKWVV